MYAVLRYSKYTNLPKDHLNTEAEKVIRFVANGPVYDFVDVCDSD